MNTGRSPTADELAFLLSVDSPTIANAIERCAVRDRSEGYVGGRVRCAFPELGVVVGRALTVTMTNGKGAARTTDGLWRMWRALAAMEGPVIIAIADGSGAPHRVAYAGEIMATLAKRLGAVGIMTDGALRDVDEVRALGIHYFMRYPVVSHGNFEVVEVGTPIELDGQVIQNGDLLHGDVNGIVVVPWRVLDRLPSEVADVRASEAADLAYIASAEFDLEQYRVRKGYGSA